MKTILLIEDNLDYQMFLKHQIQSKIKDAVIISASTLEEGKKIFKDNPNPNLIIMDGFLGTESSYPNTIPLVQEIRKTYLGPMIANSSEESARNLLVLAGCTHYVPDKKVCDELAVMLLV